MGRPCRSDETDRTLRRRVSHELVQVGIPAFGGRNEGGMASAADAFSRASTKHCVECHPVDQVTQKHKNDADWRSTVSQMVSYGVDLSPDEVDTLVSYLAQNFGLTPVKRSK